MGFTALHEYFELSQPSMLGTTTSPYGQCQVSHIMQKHVFGYFRLDKIKPACSATWNFGYSKYTLANYKGTDQTARMHRLICAFVVCIWHKTRFRMTRPISNTHLL